MASGADPFTRSQTNTKVTNNQFIGQSTSLTNLTANSDALGKVIPRTWGRSVIGGELVWASPYFIITSDFKSETQFFTNINYYDDSKVDEVISDGTRVTLTQKQEYGIDLCYSCGFEGDVTASRKVYRVTINGTLVYDGLTNYVMPGIGFDIRPANSLAIPATMSKYKLSGKYFYPGQTLIVFTQFRIAQWGGALPQSVEVEFLPQGALGAVLDINNSAAYAAYPNLNSDATFCDFTRRIQYYLVSDVSAGLPGLMLFNLDSGAYIGTRILTGDTAGLSDPSSILFQMSFASNLNVLCFTNYVTNNVVLLSLNGNEAKVKSVGMNDTRGVICLTDDFTTCQFWTMRRGDGAKVLNVTRDGEGQLTVSVLGAGKTSDISSFTDATGWGNGGVVLDEGKFWIIGINGALTAVVPPADGSMDGYVPSMAISFNKGAVAQYNHNTKGAKFIAYGPDGKVVRTRDYTQLNIIIRYAAGALRRLEGKPSERYYGGAHGTLRYLDLIDLTYTEYQVGSGTEFINRDVGYDFFTNTLVVHEGSSHRLVGPGIKSARIRLMDFIRSLYVNAKMYQPFQITAEDDVLDEIGGAVLMETIDVNDLVANLCSLFRLSKRSTDNGVHFLKTSSVAKAIHIDLTLSIDDVAVELNEDDISTPIKSKRTSESDAPSLITLKYLDPNNGYKEGTVTYRKAGTQTNEGSTLDIALPIIMTGQEALNLVQQAAVDTVSKTFTHEFRLPPSIMAVAENGDVFEIVDGPYRTIVEITDIDFNADLSASCKSTSVGAVNVLDINVPQAPDPTPSIGTGTPPVAVGYVIDSPLLQRADDPGPGSILLFETIHPKTLPEIYAGAYFGRRPVVDGVPGEWYSLPNFINGRQPVVLTAKTALTNRRWTIDPDPLPFTKVSGELPADATLVQLQGSPRLNAAWYGAPGRWEIIKFMSSANGELTGILRGLRGTEINCGKHQVGDLIILATDGIITEKRDAGNVGAVEEWRPVSTGLGFNSATSLPLITLAGNTARPYAPAHVNIEVQGADLKISWERRDRHWRWGLVDQDPADPRSWRVRIMAPDGLGIVREFEVQGQEYVTYTSADRTTDGTIGLATLPVNVAQIGAIGPGFNETVTLNAS